MDTPVPLPLDFKVFNSKWLADIPAERGTLFGQPLTMEVMRHTSDRRMTSEVCEFIQRILQALPEVLGQAAEALSGYQTHDPGALEHVQNPRIQMAENSWRDEGWVMVVERDDWPDFGWDIEFVGTEIQEIWAGD